MIIITHNLKDTKAAELTSDKLIVSDPETALELLGNLYYGGFDKVILHQNNISRDFFDLKNGMAGEILQKFSNYRARLAIIGNFTEYTAPSIIDFIYESNKGKQVNFVNSISEALDKLK